MPLNQQAYHDGSLGILGSLPPVYARRDGVLGALPPVHSFRDGSLGVLGSPPVANAYNSGVFGALPPAPAFRDGSLGMPMVHEVSPGMRKAAAQRRFLAALRRQPRAASSAGARFSASRRLSSSVRGFGEYFAQDGLGADLPVQPMIVALGGLALATTAWYLLKGKRRGRR